MRRVGWQRPALLAGVAGVVVLVAVALGVRALAMFTKPIRSAAGLSPSASSSAPTLSILPQTTAAMGAESEELRSLRTGDAGAPMKWAPSSVLFASAPARDLRPKMPEGLKRSDLLARRHPTIEAYAYHATHDERTRGALLEALRRSGRVRVDVSRILDAWHVPEEFFAVAFVESGVEPTHTSGGGVGLYRLTASVAGAYGLAMLEDYDERRAVALSTEAFAHYLADLHERFGSWELAAFAYFAGYDEALRALSVTASRDFWELVPTLPQDAVDAVMRVFGVALVLKNRERFGLDGAKVDAPKTASDLEVPHGVKLAIVARAANIPLDELRALNPEYMGERVPKTDFPMVLHIPGGALGRAREFLYAEMSGRGGGRDVREAEDAGAALADAPGGRASPQATTVAGGRAKRLFHRVQDGETIDSLASRFRVPPQQIASDNSLDRSAPLRKGQLLTIRQPESTESP